jgi:protein-S-isoprenylcysteine O-methyltransferase Ste14
MPSIGASLSRRGVSDSFVDALTAALARRRVALGFISGAGVLVLAHPTSTSIAVGMTIAAAGEALRIWAAGHVNKAREVTSSGPYRWVAHPLYLGSSIMGLGLAVACASVGVAALIALYLTLTLTAAMRREESFLRQAFGDRYDRYRRGDLASSSDGARAIPPSTLGRDDLSGVEGQASERRFSMRQALANREHRAVVGLLLATLLLVWKATYHGPLWPAGG